MNKKVILALAVLCLGTIFCASTPGTVAGPTDTPDLRTSVAATLTSIAGGGSATATLSTTPMSAFPATGMIAGRLSYPSEFIPPLRVAAFNSSDGSFNYTDTSAGQSTYQIEVPAGTYTVVAYTLGGGGVPSGLAGGYTQMVPCGLTASCTDHTLIQVTVAAGATVSGIDPGDWYALSGTFPPRPGP